MRTKAYILAVLLFASLGFKCGDNGGSGGGPNVPAPTFTGAMHCSKQVSSQKGVTICSGDSIGANVPQIVDQQLDDLFRIAEAAPNNYRACPDGFWHQEVPCFSTHGTYHVWLIRRSPQCENPGFTELVTSAAWPDGYDNDPNGWDKDPTPGRTLLCVAGMLEAGGGHMAGIAAPGMGVVDAIDQMPIVRYEGEHNLLAQVDQARYAATQYHYGANGGHPILGDGPTSLKGAKRKAPAPPDDTPQVKDDQGRVLWLTK